MFRKETVVENLGVDDRLFLLFGIPITAFLVPLLFLGESLTNGIFTFLPKFWVSIVFSTIYWIGIRWICIRFRKKYPHQKDTKKRLLHSSIWILIGFVLVNFLCKDIKYLFHAEGIEPKVDYLDIMIASFTIIVLVLAIYESIFFYVRWKLALVEAEKLKRENMQSQLESLKNQVNPHFLFNSLNTLAYLIPENKDKAVKFVQKLSKVYRYILEIKDNKLIPLEEEMNFLKAYVFLLNERFGDNLKIEVFIPEDYLQLSIVPLAMQILFENAIKHNIISSENPLWIKVSVEENRLSVTNNLQKKHLDKTSQTRIGLQNIKSRYAYFTDQQILIIEAKDEFRVSIPLLNVAYENSVII